MGDLYFPNILNSHVHTSLLSGVIHLSLNILSTLHSKSQQKYHPCPPNPSQIPTPSQIHAQSLPKPNNKIPQPPYDVEIIFFQNDPPNINDIHLRSRRSFQKEDSSIFIKNQHQEEEYPDENKESWTTFSEQHPLEVEIEKFLL